MDARVRIREAKAADADLIASLSAQLGYPTDAATIERRLRDIALHLAGVVLVAELDDTVSGWAHVLPQRHLELDPHAELAGLVIGERARGAGIGAALLRAVEAWTCDHGYNELVVRSNIIRESAHRFYLREGYVEQKRQAVFLKQLV